MATLNLYGLGSWLYIYANFESGLKRWGTIIGLRSTSSPSKIILHVITLVVCESVEPLYKKCDSRNLSCIRHLLYMLTLKSYRYYSGIKHWGTQNWAVGHPNPRLCKLVISAVCFYWVCVLFHLEYGMISLSSLLKANYEATFEG